MSHIFDALQKADAEHARQDGIKRCEVLELLRNAESRAAAGAQRGEAEIHGNGNSSESGAGALTPIRPAGRLEAISSVRVAPALTSRLITLLDAQSAATEAFRVLAVRLRQLQRDAAIRSVLISSAIPQEGKSLVAGNLACTLAVRSQQKILLLEGDGRRPALSALFGMSGSAGLQEYCRGKAELTDCIHYLECAGVWFLPAGQAAEDTPSFLQIPSLQSLLERLNEWFDWILVDSPPMLPLADASVWMRITDATLLVVRQGLTQRRELEKALESFDRKKLLGAVLNCASKPAHSEYYYGSWRSLSESSSPRKGGGTGGSR